MKISVDGGGLCSQNKYGNYIFSENLLRALSRYDKRNQYVVYSFCPKPKNLSLGRNLEYKILRPKFLWSSIRVSAEELINKRDYHLALNQSVPFAQTKTITFLHGLSFYFYPHLYPDSITTLKRQLGRASRKSNRIVVSSLRVKKELLTISSHLKNVVVIPFGVPTDMLIPNKIKSRKNYFLSVGMDHEVKNLKLLKEVFGAFQKKNRGFRLVMVKNLNNRRRLRELYAGATAYLTTSYYESFNLPVLEALAQNTPVIGLKSAIIPELRNYINIARNEKEFTNLLNSAVSGELKDGFSKQIKQEFSWEKYVQKLTELYKW